MSCRELDIPHGLLSGYPWSYLDPNYLGETNYRMLVYAIVYAVVHNIIINDILAYTVESIVLPSMIHTLGS